MDQTQNSEIYDQLQTLLEKGDEEEVRKFIGEHSNEFSEEVQQKIAFALFEEALDEQGAGRSVRDALQKQGLEAAAALDSGQRNLEDQLKIQEIKTKLNE